MGDLKIKLFSILNSIGPSMSAQQSEDISEAFNELDRLRAEYDALQESVTAKDLLIANLTELNKEALEINARHMAEIASLEGKLEVENGDILWRDNEIRRLREKKFTRFNDKECWLYQGDGQDNLQSLSCPVVIAPEVLLDLTKQLAAANGRVESKHAALELAHGHMILWQTPQYQPNQNVFDAVTAALSDLPEADKEKS